ncbi:MAG: hypothetical protein ACKOB6_05365, partial [Candidatus Kapaibacterium sp.]
METDRLMIPSKDLQRTMEHLWTMVRQVGEALVAQRDEDSEARVRVAYLESELESMASTVQTQNAALEQWREEVRSADAVNGTMQEVNGRNEMLQQTLDRLTGELESLRGQAASDGEADTVNAELRSEMTAVTIRAQNMENVLQERGRDLAAAHVEIARVMEELDEHRTE